MPPGNLFRLKAGSLFAGSVKREEELERKESLWHLFAKSLGGHRTRTRKTITDTKMIKELHSIRQQCRLTICMELAELTNSETAAATP